MSRCRTCNGSGEGPRGYCGSCGGDGYSDDDWDSPEEERSEDDQ